MPSMMDMAKLGLPLFLATTFGVIYTKIDIVMLERMVGEAAAALFGLRVLKADDLNLLKQLYRPAE